jgi:trans-aconitate 2-methyltransferase
MTPTPVWDPDIYARFKAERLRPGFEMMARVPDDLPPGDIYDLGCGGGEHAGALAVRFPDRIVFGVDRSTDMLAAAARTGGRVTWVEADLRNWAPSTPPALIFSNAALHWLDDHAALFARLLGHLATGGVLAVQMPNNLDNAAHRVGYKLVEAWGLAEASAHLFRGDWVLQPSTYYDLLRAAGAVHVDIWESVYQHQIAAGGVTSWVEGTMLRPVLSTLDADCGAAFLSAYRTEVDTVYPPQADGVTLYPQSRIFMLARR